MFSKKFKSNKNNNIEIINTESSKREDQVRNELIFQITNKCRTVLDRLFPDKKDKELDKWQAEIIAQAANQSIEKSAIVHEFRKKAMREILNQTLIEKSMNSRGQNVELLSKILQSLSQQMSKHDLFIAKTYDDSLEKALTIEDDYSRRRFLDNQKRITDLALDMMWIAFKRFVDTHNILID